jgi:hypothetical protein
VEDGGLGRMGGGGDGICLECELDTKTPEENMGLEGAKTQSMKQGVGYCKGQIRVEVQKR